MSLRQIASRPIKENQLIPSSKGVRTRPSRQLPKGYERVGGSLTIVPDRLALNESKNREASDIKPSAIPLGFGLVQAKPGMDIAANAIETISSPIVNVVRAIQESRVIARSLKALATVEMPVDLTTQVVDGKDVPVMSNNIGHLLQALKKEHGDSLRKQRTASIWKSINSALGAGLAGLAIAVSLGLAVLAGPVGIALVSVTLALTLSSTLKNDWLMTSKDISVHNKNDIVTLQNLVKSELDPETATGIRYKMADGCGMSLVEMVSMIITAGDKYGDGGIMLAENGLGLFI